MANYEKGCPVPKSPFPTDGQWDWKRRYFGLGQKVMVYGWAVERDGKVAFGDVKATVTSFTINKWGRVSYCIRFEDGSCDKVDLATLVPEMRDEVKKQRELEALRAENAELRRLLASKGDEPCTPT